MIAICLTVYLVLGLVFIGSLALAASRSTPQCAQPVEAEITNVHPVEAPLRHAA